MALDAIATHRSHGGLQGVYRHASRETKTDMVFSVYLPPGAENGGRFPVVWWLSGLSCTHANVTEKGEYRRACAELGLIFVAPDTSPRGPGVPDDSEGAFDFGLGAGFYVDATVAPYAANYRMWSYVTRELPELIAASFPADMNRQAILGHSMGGHGALVAALRNPDMYRSVSAFSPIVSPSDAPWGVKAFTGYLGPEKAVWRAYDAVRLIRDGATVNSILVDIGDRDPFLTEQLRPEMLERACADASIPLTLRRHAGYDHSYYFVSTFMADHLRWHSERLR